MQSWQIFLEQQGAVGFDASTGTVGGFSGSESTMASPSTDFMVPLCDTSLIVASGIDAASFLHNQLTNDVEHIGQDQARLAGYCTPKGRLLATLLVWRSGDQIFLHLPRALQPGIRKRLQMFILRAKVVLADADAQSTQLGLAGPAVAAALRQWFSAVPTLPYTLVHNDAGTLIRLADTDDGMARYLWISDVATLTKAWPHLALTLHPSGTDAWRLGRIRAGIALITPATQEKFVPQMVNFELVGGVSFKKGCYPGQEIVARSHYLGKPKRRMVQATVDAVDVAAGTEVFASDDPEQACGMIVEAATTDMNSSLCLVEIKLTALETSVHLGHVHGPRLAFAPASIPVTTDDDLTA
ncbi:MAG: folate-binding protein [Pseudomonadota bacterium]